MAKIQLGNIKKISIPISTTPEPESEVGTETEVIATPTATVAAAEVKTETYYDETPATPTHDPIPGVSIPDDQNRTIDTNNDTMGNDDEPDFSTMTKKEIKKWKKNQVDARYKRFKRKQAIVFSCIIIFTLMTTAFGTYNVFFKHQPTYEEITTNVNRINQRYGFPRDGVATFLIESLPVLTHESYSGALKNTFIDIRITDISEKSTERANVYFTAKMQLTEDDNRELPKGVVVPDEPIKIQGVVPIKYDWDRGTYEATDLPRITPVEDTNSDSGKKWNAAKEMKNNPLYSFPNDSTLLVDTRSDEYIGAKKFVTNFLTILYNQKGDYSTFYKGGQRLAPVGTFQRLKTFNMYKQKNAMGFNTEIEFENQIVPGASFMNKTYLCIEKSGKTFVVTKIQ